MASTSYSTPKFNNQSNDSQSTQRLIQSITENIQKIAQNGINIFYLFKFCFNIHVCVNLNFTLVSQIENMNMQIGTSKDSESLRDKL